MTTNTRPVPNTQSPIGEVKKDASGNLKIYLISPWLQFFQQFVQKAPSPETNVNNPYTPNATGSLVITGGVGVILTRGQVSVTLGNGVFTIPMSIGDTVSWSSVASAQFFGS